MKKSHELIVTTYLTLSVYTEVAMVLFVITRDPVLHTVFLPYTARLHRSGYGPFRHHKGPRSPHCFPTLHCPSTQKWLWSFSSSQGTPFSTLFSYLTLPVYTEVAMVLFVITRDPVLHTVFQLHVKSIVQRPARKSTLFISYNNIDKNILQFNDINAFFDTHTYFGAVSVCLDGLVTQVPYLSIGRAVGQTFSRII